MKSQFKMSQYGYLIKLKQTDSKIHIDMERTQNRQNNFRKEEESWSTKIT